MSEGGKSPRNRLSFNSGLVRSGGGMPKSEGRGGGMKPGRAAWLSNDPRLLSTFKSMPVGRWFIGNVPGGGCDKFGNIGAGLVGVSST